MPHWSKPAASESNHTGSELNIKITTPEDLLFGECIATRLDAAVKPTP